MLGRREAAATALAAKHRLGVPWQKIAATLDRSLVWSTSAVLGQQPLDAEQARALGRLLHLEDEVVDALQLPPVRGADMVDSTEPVVYPAPGGHPGLRQYAGRAHPRGVRRRHHERQRLRAVF